MRQDDHRKRASGGVQVGSLRRRDFLARTAAAAASPFVPAVVRGAPSVAKTYTAAVIGHTGRGDYGHGLDVVWADVPHVQLVAVADPDQKGLAAAAARLKAPKPYRDYRRMLDEVKPDLISIAPRWVDQHHDMLLAAVQRGVRGIYLEKPLCRTLAEADAMIAACQKHNVKVAIAFQTRYSPKLPVIAELIRAGAIGQVLEFRARGKEDARGGAEDLWVLGPHLMNLMEYFGGKPQWCFASVSQQGRPIRREDVRPGNEGIGLLAGDEVHAMYRLAGGATGYFDSVRNAGGGPRFALWICGSKGVVELTTGYMPGAFLLPDPSWSVPRGKNRKWLPISSAGLDKAEPIKEGTPHRGNVEAVKDLIASIERDRKPLADITDARTTLEMIAAVFESQRLGRPAALPLQDRGDPLARL
ncbi:MAG: Gfo/Idh/MocA family protein [Thermoguttaceae bacterium]